jgi:hypothetical protein
MRRPASPGCAPLFAGRAEADTGISSSPGRCSRPVQRRHRILKTTDIRSPRMASSAFAKSDEIGAGSRRLPDDTGPLAGASGP